MEQHVAAHVSAWLLQGLRTFLLFLLLRALGWSAAIPLSGGRALGGILAEPMRGQRKTFAFWWVLLLAFGSTWPRCRSGLGVPPCTPPPTHIFSSRRRCSEHLGRVLGR